MQFISSDKIHSSKRSGDNKEDCQPACQSPLDPVHCMCSRLVSTSEIEARIVHTFVLLMTLCPCWFNLRLPVASEITLRLWWTSWSFRVLQQQQSRTLKTMEDATHSVIDECFEKSKVRLVDGGQDRTQQPNKRKTTDQARAGSHEATYQTLRCPCVLSQPTQATRSAARALKPCLSNSDGPAKTSQL